MKKGKVFRSASLAEALFSALRCPGTTLAFEALACSQQLAACLPRARDTILGETNTALQTLKLRPPLRGRSASRTPPAAS